MEIIDIYLKNLMYWMMFQYISDISAYKQGDRVVMESDSGWIEWWSWIQIGIIIGSKS